MHRGKKILRRSGKRVVAGVCAGVANYYRLESDFVRLHFMLTTAASGILPGLIIYLVLWMLMRRPEVQTA